MSLYAIGDIQGCHAEFCQLLELVGFSARDDRLWLVGDLVNRGPGSLAVLREVMALGDAAVTVLGNHDFHLLTVAAGHARAHRKDTIAPILEAPDRELLLGWLRRRPLVAAEGGFLLVHAGLMPAWTTAACPSPTSATTSIPPSALRIRRTPSRINVWSSANRTRIAAAGLSGEA